MKHLIRYNESKDEINDIMNIATDEELFVATPKIGKELSWGVQDETYYILRYTETDDDHYNYQNPIMNTQQFIQIIENIIQRLNLLGVIKEGMRPTYYRKLVPETPNLKSLSQFHKDRDKPYNRSINEISYVGDQLKILGNESEANIIYATFTLSE